MTLVLPGKLSYMRLGILLALFLILSFVVRHTANRAFYVPDPNPPRKPVNPPYNLVETRIPTEGGNLSAWVLTPSNGQVMGTMVFCHGNGGNLETHTGFCDFLPQHGYRTLMFDYRGYGASTRLQPTRDTTMADARAALDYARSQWGACWLMGHSLGASIAIVLAGACPGQVNGVIAVSPFSSYRAIARKVLRENLVTTLLGWPLSFGVGTQDDPIDYVAKIAPTPLLLVHGRADEIVPYAMSQELFAKAQDPKELLLLDGVSHNCGWNEMGPSFTAKVLEFLRR